MARLIFLLSTLVVLFANWLLSRVSPHVWWSFIFFGPVIIVGFADMLQTRHTLRRNFPVIGNFRYLMEFFRPEINQYFVESNTSGMPFNRLDRSLVYQRSKGELDTIPFGTQKNVYEIGYEWVTHSLIPKYVDPSTLRVAIGNNGSQVYQASIFNIGAMSFGSLSANAVLALNQGAQMGGFAQNTGEGGLTKYHLSGGDVIWQIGTGYFGCRNAQGKFCAEKFVQKASLAQVKMIEVKLSQGAKPGHGGILPRRRN